MNLNDLYLVVRTKDLKITAITDRPFQGDPDYLCEEATPAQVSRACKQDTRLRIIRHN